MTITVIGSVPFWDSYYGEPSPQNWMTDGTYLYDNAGTAVAPINSATIASAGTSPSNVPAWLIPGVIGLIVVIMLIGRR